MAGVYGNDNLNFVRKCQYLTVDGNSDQATALSPNTEAVTLYAAAACWVLIGTDPTAVKPGAEKTRGETFYVPATTFIDVAIPKGTDAAPMKVAAIQDSGGGSLYIYERSSL